MEDIAPGITRQRLLIEGYYSGEMSTEILGRFLKSLATELGLRTYAEPVIHQPSGDGKEENQGFDAFVPLIDSGISVYVWTGPKFFSVVMFTCKRFGSEKAVSFTREYFKVSDRLVFSEF